MLFALKNQGLEVNLLLSTLNPESDTQSDTSIVSRHMQSVRKKSSSRGRSKSNRSTSRSNKPTTSTNSTTDSILRRRNVEETNHGNTIPSRGTPGNREIPGNVAITETTPIRNELEKDQAEPERNRLFALSPADTTSPIAHKRIPENHRKLVKSVFSSITKRKSTSDDENFCEEKAADPLDLDDSIPCSPPRQQMTKKARMMFQKCFQTTFDPRMLPGHDMILVEDSDDNNSD